MYKASIVIVSLLFPILASATSFQEKHSDNTSTYSTIYEQNHGGNGGNGGHGGNGGNGGHGGNGGNGGNGR